MLANEIARLMELNKMKAELEFKKNWLISKGNKDKVVAYEAELEEASRQTLELESKITAKGITLFYPNMKKINELAGKLSAIPQEKLFSAMEQKEGEVYSLFESKGKLIKRNMENRWEIALLMEFTNSLPSGVRDSLIEMSENGEIGELDVSILEENQRMKLFRMLNRAGLECELLGYNIIPKNMNGDGVKWNEIWVETSGRKIWASPEKIEEVKKFEKDMEDAGRTIQIMNAERQIRDFSDAEENKFNEAQKKYLEMIRKKEKMLTD
ncbi:hypothetical protein KJ780_05085 [Candidatus Micrarchaeota archaeon]|nr:hypothetical protein [Candidatus Micrarchaeota archaeon]